MKYIVGAYTSAPSLGVDDKRLEIDFYQRLISTIPDIQGLEIPFWGEDIHKYGTNFLLNYIQPQWDNILTCIPGTMNQLKKNPCFGLASNDYNGRQEAIAMHQKANATVKKINDFFGRKSISAVHIATAPTCDIRGISSSIDSLRRSLEELLSWNWMGARIVIEHCDAFVNNKPFEKGFMSIEDEISVFRLLEKPSDIGISINWARSAIEGKCASIVMKHLELAKRSGYLAGLIFSGTSSKHDKNYGAWQDLHMPFAQSFNIDHYESNSLLTQQNIVNSLKYKNDLDYIGIKLLSMPIDKSEVERRVGINRDAIFVLNNLLN